MWLECESQFRFGHLDKRTAFYTLVEQLAMPHQSLVKK